MSARTQIRHWQSRRIDDNLLRQVTLSPETSTPDTSLSAHVGYGCTYTDQDVEIDCEVTAHTDQDVEIDCEVTASMHESTEGLHDCSELEVDHSELADEHELCNDLSENKCTICEQYFKCYFDLTEHRRDSHMTEPSTSSDPSGATSSPSAAGGKVGKWYKHKTGAFKCEFCAKVYKYNFDMSRHVKQRHLYISRRCQGDKVLNEKIKAYVKKNLPFKCKVCGKLYYSQKTLSYHMNRAHSKAASAQAKCVKEIGERSRKLLSIINRVSSKTGPIVKTSETSSSNKSPASKGNKVKKAPPKDKTSSRTKNPVQPKVPTNGTLMHPNADLSSPTKEKSPLVKKPPKLSDKRRLPVEEIHEKSEKTLKCKLCQKMYKTRPGIVYHLQVTHLYCTMCYKQFCYQKIYDKHMQLKHNQHKVVVDDNYFSDLSKVKVDASVFKLENTEVKCDSVDTKPQSLATQECTVKTASQNSTTVLSTSYGLSSLDADPPVKIPEGTILSPVKIKLSRLPSDTAALQNFAHSMKYVVVPCEKQINHDVGQYDKKGSDMKKSTTMNSVVSTGPKGGVLSTRDEAKSYSSLEIPVTRVTRPKLGPKSKPKSTRVSYERKVVELPSQPVTVSNTEKLSDETDKCDHEPSAVKEETSNCNKQTVRKTLGRPRKAKRRENTVVLSASVSETHVKEDTTPAVITDRQTDLMKVDDFNTGPLSVEPSILEANTSKVHSALKSPTSIERITRSSTQPAAGENSDRKDSTELSSASSLIAARGIPKFELACDKDLYSALTVSDSNAKHFTKSSSGRTTRKDKSSERSHSSRLSRTSTKSSELLTPQFTRSTRSTSQPTSESSQITSSTRSPSQPTSESSQITGSTRSPSQPTSESSEITGSIRSLSSPPFIRKDTSFESSQIAGSTGRLSTSPSPRTRKGTTSSESSQIIGSTRRQSNSPSPRTRNGITSSESLQSAGSIRRRSSSPSPRTRKGITSSESLQRTGSTRSISPSPRTRKGTTSSESVQIIGSTRRQGNSPSSRTRKGTTSLESLQSAGSTRRRSSSPSPRTRKGITSSESLQSTGSTRSTTPLPQTRKGTTSLEPSQSTGSTRSISPSSQTRKGTTSLEPLQSTGSTRSISPSSRTRKGTTSLEPLQSTGSTRSISPSSRTRKGTTSLEPLQSTGSTRSISPSSRTRKGTTSSESAHIIGSSKSTPHSRISKNLSLSLQSSSKANTSNSSEVTNSSQHTRKGNTSDMPANISSVSTETSQPISDTTSLVLASTKNNQGLEVQSARNGSYSDDTSRRQTEPLQSARNGSYSDNTSRRQTEPLQSARNGSYSDDTSRRQTEPLQSARNGSYSDDTSRRQTEPLQSARNGSYSDDTSRRQTEPPQSTRNGSYSDDTSRRQTEPPQSVRNGSDSDNTSRRQTEPLQSTRNDSYSDDTSRRQTEPPQSARNGSDSEDTSRRQTEPPKEKNSSCKETRGRREVAIEHSTLHSRSKMTCVTQHHDIRELMFGQSCSAFDLHVDDQSSPEHHDDLWWKIVEEEKSYDLSKLTLKITRDVKTGARNVKTQDRFFCNLTELKLKIVRDFSQQKRTVLTDDDRKCRGESNTDLSDTSTYSTPQTVQAVSSVEEPSSDLANNSFSVTSDSDDFTSPRKTNMKAKSHLPSPKKWSSCDEGIFNSGNNSNEKTSGPPHSVDTVVRKSLRLTDSVDQDDASSATRTLCVEVERKLVGNCDVDCGESGDATSQKRTFYSDVDKISARHHKDESSPGSLPTTVTEVVSSSGDNIPVVVGPTVDSVESSAGNLFVGERLKQSGQYEEKKVAVVGLQMKASDSDSQFRNANTIKQHCSDKKPLEMYVHQPARLQPLQKSPAKVTTMDKRHCDTEDTLTSCSKSVNNPLKLVKERGVAKVVLEKLQDSVILRETRAYHSVRKRGYVTKSNKPAPACVKKQRLVHQESLERTLTGSHSEAMEDSKEQHESENMLRDVQDKYKNVTVQSVPNQTPAPSVPIQTTAPFVPSQTPAPSVISQTPAPFVPSQTPAHSDTSVDEIDGIASHCSKADCDLLSENLTASQETCGEGNGSRVLMGDAISQHLLKGFDESDLDLLLKDDSFDNKLSDMDMEVTLSDDGLYATVNTLSGDANNNHFKGKVLKEIMEIMQFASPGIFQTELEIEQCAAGQESIGFNSESQNGKRLEKKNNNMSLETGSIVIEKEPKDLHAKDIGCFGQLDRAKKTSKANHVQTVMESSLAEEGIQQDKNRTEIDLRNTSITNKNVGFVVQNESIIQTEVSINISEKGEQKEIPTAHVTLSKSPTGNNRPRRERTSLEVDKKIVSRKGEKNTGQPRCSVCGNCFSSENILRKHKMEYHPKDFRKLPGYSVLCKLCGMVYANKHNLRRHIANRHSEVVANSDEAFNLVCEEMEMDSESASTDPPNCKVKPKDTYDTNIQYRCLMCNIIYKNMSSVIWHIESSHKNLKKSVRHCYKVETSYDGDRSSLSESQEVVYSLLENSMKHQADYNVKMDESERAVHNLLESFGEEVSFDTPMIQADPGIVHCPETQPGGIGHADLGMFREVGQDQHGGQVKDDHEDQVKDDHADQQGHEHPEKILQEPIPEEIIPAHQGDIRLKHHTDVEHECQGDVEHECEGDVEQECQGDVEQECEGDVEQECEGDVEQDHKGNENQKAVCVVEGKDLATKPLLVADQNGDVLCSLSETAPLETPVECSSVREEMSCVKDRILPKNYSDMRQDQHPTNYMCKSDEKICAEIADQTGFSIHQNSVVRLVSLPCPGCELTIGDLILKPEGSGQTVVWKVSTVGSGITEPHHVNCRGITEPNPVNCHSGITEPNPVNCRSGITEPNPVNSRSGITEINPINSRSGITEINPVNCRSGTTEPNSVNSRSGITEPNPVNSHEDLDVRHVDQKEDDERESMKQIQTIVETKRAAESVLADYVARNRFVCELCGLTYVSKKSLKRHNNNKHPDTATKSDGTLRGRRDEVESHSNLSTGKGNPKFTQIQTLAGTTSKLAKDKATKNTGVSAVVDEAGPAELGKSRSDVTDGSGNKDTSAIGEDQIVCQSDSQSKPPEDKSDSHTDILKDTLETQSVLESTPNTQPAGEASLGHQPGREKRQKGPKTRKDKESKKAKKEKSKSKLMEEKVTLSVTPTGSAITAFEMAISTPAYSQRKIKKRKLDRQTSTEGPAPSKRPCSSQSKARLDEKPPGNIEEEIHLDTEERFPSHEEEIFPTDTDEAYASSANDGFLNPWQMDTEFQSGSETTSPRKMESPKKSNKKSIDKIVQGIIQRQKDIENKKNLDKLDPPEVDLPVPFEEILAQSKIKAAKSAEVTQSTTSFNDDNSNMSSGSVKSGKSLVKPVNIFSSLRMGPTVKFGKSFRKVSSEITSIDEEPQQQFRSPLDRVGGEVTMKFGTMQESKKVGEASSKLKKQSNKNYLIDILKDIPSIYDYSNEEGPYVSPWDNPSVSKADKSVVSGSKPPIFSKIVHFGAEMNDAAAGNSNEDNVTEISIEDGTMEISNEDGKMEEDCQKDTEDSKDCSAAMTDENAEETQYFSTLSDDEENHKLTIAEDEDENMCKYKCDDVEDSDDDQEFNYKSDNDDPEEEDDGQNNEDEDDEQTKDSDSEKEEEEYDFLSPSIPHERSGSDEERDILSIDYDSDEASFLDDVRSVMSRKSVSKRRSLVAVEAELEAAERSSVALSAMDLASESSLVQSRIQCNISPMLTPAVVSRAAKIFKTGGGYCHVFLLHGNCRRQKTCRYQHDVPPVEWFFVQGQATILDSRTKPNKDRAFEVYQLLKTLNVRPITRAIVEVLLQLAVDAWDTDAAFQLFGDLQSTDLINNMTSSMLVRLCNSSPQNYTDQLWALFQVVLEKGLQFNGDCMDTVVQAFSMRRENVKLWEVLHYSNSIPDYVVPMQVLHVLLFTCLKSPEEYLPAITKWAETCDHNLLRQLDHRMLTELYGVCMKHNNKVLGFLLERLTETLLPGNQGEQPDTTDILEEQDWNGDSVGESPITSSDEYKGRQHRIRGCKLTKNWEHLGSIFVELCCDLELSNPHYIQEYIYVLTDATKPESMAQNFKLFLQAIHEEMETKMSDNMDVLDEPSLARIGAGLLGWCHQEALWEQGYHLLYVMHQARVYYHKCSGQAALGTALIAMEVCLNTNNPESALQILERSKGQIMTTENVANVTRILKVLLDMLLEKSFTKMAFSVLVIFVEKQEQDQTQTDLSGYFNRLVRKSLATGDIHTALGVYKVQKETDTCKLNVLGLRGLLTACGKHRFDKYIEEVYESCVARKLYPPQVFDTPRSVLLSCMMTPVEMYLYVSDYLNVLYNTLCESVMDGAHLTMDNFCLTVHVWWEENPLQQADFPYLSMAPQTQPQVWQMVLYVLHKNFNPPLQGEYNPTNSCIYINPESLYTYLQEKDKNGRKQGLHIQTGAGPSGGPPKMRGRAWARPQNFSNRGRGRGRPYR